MITWGCQKPIPPHPLPPSSSLQLMIKGEKKDGADVLMSVFKTSPGKNLLKDTVLLNYLRQSAKDKALSIKINSIQEYKQRLPSSQKNKAELFAWAHLILFSKVKNDHKALKVLYQKNFPQEMRLEGRQVILTPPIVWTPDHEKEYRHIFTSWARIKLTQLRHQLISGASFEVLAKAHSQSKSASNGGLIPLNSSYFLRLSHHIQRVVQRLRPGELSQLLQDEDGVYLFSSDQEVEQLVLLGEGVFIPTASPQKKNSSPYTQQEKIDQLIQTLKNHAVLPLKVRRPNETKRSKNRRLRYNRAQKNKKNQPHTQTGQHVWSSLPSALLKSINATYYPQLPIQLLQRLKSPKDAELLSKLPLSQISPPIHVQGGLWVIRLNARRFLPSLSTPILRMIKFDLTRQGLERGWGSWGTSLIGDRLWSAAQTGVLNEALKSLQIHPSPIEPPKLPPELLQKALHSKLLAGPQSFHMNTQNGWYLIELHRRTPVSFEEVRSELISQQINNSFKIKEIERYLEELWESLRVRLIINDQSIHL